MDWTPQVAAAKRMIDSKGATMKIWEMTQGAYIATSDTYSATLTSYSAIGVITNPVVANAAGEYSKSDKLRLILSASGLPDLEKVDYKVVYGSDVWFPDKTIAVKPGGTVIIYLVDLK